MKMVFASLIALMAFAHCWRVFSDQPPKERTLREVQAFAWGDLIFEVLLLAWLLVTP